MGFCERLRGCLETEPKAKLMWPTLPAAGAKPLNRDKYPGYRPQARVGSAFRPIHFSNHGARLSVLVYNTTMEPAAIRLQGIQSWVCTTRFRCAETAEPEPTGEPSFELPPNPLKLNRELEAAELLFPY
jgi:hypothetical protein